MGLDLNVLMFIMLAVMIAAIFIGIHIGLALGITAMIGINLIFDDMQMAVQLLGTSAFSVLRDYIFATIPLFILMGDFVAKSGAAQDLFRLVNRGLHKIPGRLAVATVVGNAVFAAVTGVSIASAAAFSRIAYPEMQRYGYKRTFALGSIAGSSCLGMLIPPSVLLIVWGIITEQSIGKLFVAGILPGIALASLYILYNIIAVLRNPELAPKHSEFEEKPFTRAEVVSGFGILALIMLVLGGIWGGMFTSTEAAGIGALGAMVLGIIKGMRTRDIAQAVVDAGKTAAPILFLLLTAAVYARFLTTGGIINMINDTLTASGVSGGMAILLMVAIWLFLGMLLDSISIILLTIPIFAPLAATTGMDPFAFAIFGILAIEAGLLTPPFGLIVYTVKGSVPDPNVTLMEIFKGSLPYWLLMLVTMAVIYFYPPLVTFLPSLM